MARSNDAYRAYTVYRKICGHPQHPHVLRAYHWILQSDCINLVLEVCATDLLEYVLTKAPSGVQEDVGREWSRQLCSAAEHLHSVDVVHGDIKPENILLSGASGQEVVKLGDYGFSSLGSTGKVLTESCGTEFYLAPEVTLAKTTGPYDGRAAVARSAAMCMYVMIRGRLPFNPGVLFAILHRR